MQVPQSSLSSSRRSSYQSNSSADLGKLSRSATNVIAAVLPDDPKGTRLHYIYIATNQGFSLLFYQTRLPGTYIRRRINDRDRFGVPIGPLMMSARYKSVPPDLYQLVSDKMHRVANIPPVFVLQGHWLDGCMLYGLSDDSKTLMLGNAIRANKPECYGSFELGIALAQSNKWHQRRRATLHEVGLSRFVDEPTHSTHGLDSQALNAALEDSRRKLSQLDNEIHMQKKLIADCKKFLASDMKAVERFVSKLPNPKDCPHSVALIEGVLREEALTVECVTTLMRNAEGHAELLIGKKFELVKEIKELQACREKLPEIPNPAEFQQLEELNKLNRIQGIIAKHIGKLARDKELFEIYKRLVEILKMSEIQKVFLFQRLARVQIVAEIDMVAEIQEKLAAIEKQPEIEKLPEIKLELNGIQKLIEALACNLQAEACDPAVAAARGPKGKVHGPGLASITEAGAGDPLAVAPAAVAVPRPVSTANKAQQTEQPKFSPSESELVLLLRINLFNTCHLFLNQLKPILMGKVSKNENSQQEFALDTNLPRLNLIKNEKDYLDIVDRGKQLITEEKTWNKSNKPSGDKIQSTFHEVAYTFEDKLADIEKRLARVRKYRLGLLVDRKILMADLCSTCQAWDSATAENDTIGDTPTWNQLKKMCNEFATTESDFGMVPKTADLQEKIREFRRQDIDWCKDVVKILEGLLSHYGKAKTSAQDKEKILTEERECLERGLAGQSFHCTMQPTTEGAVLYTISTMEKTAATRRN